MVERAEARVLYDLAPVLADPAGAGRGVVWRLAESGRQLDANVVNLAPGAAIDTHTEADLDVLLVVLSGSGTLTTPAGRAPVTEGAVGWLPRGGARGLVAGEHGLVYLTAHTRRPGLTIRPRPST